MNIIFFLLLFTTVIYIYKVIKNIILIKKKERTKKKQVFKELIISIMVICVTSFCMYQIYGFLEKLKQPSLSWTKKSFTQEEINSICKGLNLKQTERYHIISAKYESGKKLSIYIHIKDDAAKKLQKNYGNMAYYSEERLKDYISRTDGVVGFFREVCGYTEEQLKKELKSLGNLNQSEKEYNKKYTNMFGAEKICVEVYPYDKEEYGIKAYVWKEEEGYGIEIMREQGLFLAVDEYKLYEIFSGKEANINKKQEEK